MFWCIRSQSNVFEPNLACQRRDVPAIEYCSSQAWNEVHNSKLACCYPTLLYIDKYCFQWQKTTIYVMQFCTKMASRLRYLLAIRMQAVKKKSIPFAGLDSHARSCTCLHAAVVLVLQWQSLRHHVSNVLDVTMRMPSGRAALSAASLYPMGNLACMMPIQDNRQHLRLQAR